MFVTASHFHPSLIFGRKAENVQIEPLVGLLSTGRLLALLTNIKRRRNTLAYYSTELITAVNCFAVQTPAVFEFSHSKLFSKFDFKTMVIVRFSWSLEGAII